MSWWTRVPLLGQRLSAGLGVALADGYFVTAIPGLGAVAPYLALACGGAIGSLSLGYDSVFTQSLLLLMAVAALGSLSAGLGAAFVAGFAVGDFFMANTEWGFSTLLTLRVPLLLSYALLAALASALPVLARLILADIPKVQRLPATSAFVVAGTLNVLTATAFTFLWVNAAPVIIRPLYTWRGGTPPVSAVAPLQGQGQWIVRAAVAALLARLVLLWLVSRHEHLRRRMWPVEVALLRGPFPQPWLDRTPVVLRVLVTAALATLLLSGLFESWWVAGIMFAALVLLGLVHAHVIALPIDGWRRLMGIVPALIRISVVIGLAAVLGSAFVEAQLRRESFTGLALFMLVPIALALAVNPGPPRRREPGS